MDLKQIREQAWQAMGERQSHPYREPGFIYYHGQRVGKVALQLREIIFPEEEQDDEVILIGSWFHDVGKGIEPHWEYGALIVEKILNGYCPQTKLDKVVEIVGGHTLRKEKAYPSYVKLVQDADILDHFGSQEIWLNFLYSAHTKKGIPDSLEFYDGEYGELVAKVRKLLNYEESVAFFEEKDQFVRTFVERFRLEGAGELIGK